MLNTTEHAMELLLDGRRITKFDFAKETDVHSVCLSQRVYEIRHNYGWDVKGRSVPGKGTLREFWLEPEEIKRIKGLNKKNEQTHVQTQNVSQKAQNEPQIEQLGIGLLGGHNYR